MKKAWLTSGLPGIRQSHLDYEALGDVEMEYDFAPGLQYPGDPEGEPEEIINCRCTVIYNVDEGMVVEEPMVEEAPVLTEAETIVPPGINTFEDLQVWAWEKFEISTGSITAGNAARADSLTLEAAKENITRMGELKAEYKAEGFKSMGTVPKGKTWYASAMYDREIDLSSKYFNDKDLLQKTFTNDQKSYYHPTGIPGKLAGKSIVDHEFGHILTTPSIINKSGIYAEIRNVKSAYTRMINGLAHKEYDLFNKMSTELLTSPAGTVAKIDGAEAKSKLYDAHWQWQSKKNMSGYLKIMDEVGLDARYKNQISSIIRSMDENYISTYAGTNLNEFAAECFSDAINNTENPSPFSLEVKKLIDKYFLR
jgi:hypothetical protein